MASTSTPVKPSSTHVVVDVPPSSAQADGSSVAPACPVTTANIRYSFVKLGVQAGISLAAIGFSAAMIATRPDSTAAESTYLPIIAAIVGFWLPSPAFAAQRA